MQELNWNDLRYLIAIARGRTLSGAARIAHVDDTTVSRRLNVLRRSLGDELCIRQPNGKFSLTDVGTAVVAHAEAMEHEADLIGDVSGAGNRDCTGTVRITSVPFLINRWIVPQLPVFLASAPLLRVEVVPESRDLSLDLREADIAVRFARPVLGGRKIVGRKIGSFAFAPYAARNLTNAQISRLPWIGYEDAMAHLPQAKWISRQVRTENNTQSGLRVQDLETAMQAVIAGVGRSLLPIPIAENAKPVRRLSNNADGVVREVWLLTHRDRHARNRIQLVADWLTSLL